ncbi:MAG TPA: hypothetical protein VNQ73_11325 [Ilumatobacter sp.]|nr:hypothetical protein [Ilumatobacter sp.]
MSDESQHDPEGGAEAIDEEVVGPLAEFPPERPLGAEDVNLSEPFVPESLAEREQRIEPLDELREETADAEWAEDAALIDVGQLVDSDDGRPDDEERMLGDIAGDAEGSEEQAMSVEGGPEVRLRPEER